MADKVVFYTNPQSRGRIIRWMLEEVGEPYTTKVIDYGEMMKSEPYVSVNPMGKVPAIEHNGNVVTEASAICLYLADAFPKAGLAPDPKDRADYYRWTLFTAGCFEAAITDKSLGVVVPAEKQGFVGYGNFDLVIKTLATAVSRNEYLAGNRFTAADLYVGSQIGFGLQFGTLPKLAEFEAYWERLKAREAYLRAAKLDDELIKK